MSEIVDFLRARLDEDEAWAHNPECDQDPDRLLREVEAKRRIIARHEAALRAYETARQAEVAQYPDPSSTVVRNVNHAWTALQTWASVIEELARVYTDKRPERK